MDLYYSLELQRGHLKETVLAIPKHWNRTAGDVTPDKEVELMVQQQQQQQQQQQHSTSESTLTNSQKTVFYTKDVTPDMERGKKVMEHIQDCTNAQTATMQTTSNEKRNPSPGKPHRSSCNNGDCN